MAEAPNSEQFYPAQLVLLALGFLGPETAIVKELGLDQDARGNVKADTKSYKTSMDNVYACGDARRGQSLIVWVGFYCFFAFDRIVADKTLGSAGYPRGTTVRCQR